MQILLFSLISLSNSFLAYKLLLSLRKYRIREVKNLVDAGPRDLPSASVLIPARNEQIAMRSCLEMVLASDYPKLEVIVLDDNSVDNTSDEIKRFAHAGVRFVSGEKPPEGWLGRNSAYDRLSTEASGDLLLFLSVDTKIKPKTISKMVNFMIDNQTKMLSVLPSRSDNYRFSVLFSTLRYYLELILARVSSPPSSSGIWMIDRIVLTEELGGLHHYRQAVMPEAEIIIYQRIRSFGVCFFSQCRRCSCHGLSRSSRGSFRIHGRFSGSDWTCNGRHCNEGFCSSYYTLYDTEYRYKPFQ